MLTRNQKSKIVYDVKELKEYFDKRFNELKTSLDANNNTLENFESEMKSGLQKFEDKIDNKNQSIGIKQETPSAASNNTGITKQRNTATL